MDMSTYGTSAILTRVSTALPRDNNLKDWRARVMTGEEKDDMQKANDLIDRLDGYFKPTIQPEQLTASLDDEGHGDGGSEAHTR